MKVNQTIENPVYRGATHQEQDRNALADATENLVLALHGLATVQARMERRLGNEASAPRAARVALEALRHAATLADAALELVPRD